MPLRGPTTMKRPARGFALSLLAAIATLIFWWIMMVVPLPWPR